MEITHKIKYVDGYEFIQIIVNYPDEYEFSLDYNKFKENVHNVSTQIKNYINTNFSNLKDKTFVLVLNGVLVGTILLSSLTQTIPITKNISQTPSENQTQETTSKLDSAFEKKVQTLEIESQETNNDENTTLQTTNTNQNNSSTATTSTNKKTTTAPSSQVNQQEQTQTQTASEIKVNLKLASGQVISLNIEDYVTGVVSAEIPASFNIEAIKAQAVAARTYAYKNISKTLSVTTSDQVYKTNNQLKSMWGNSYTTYYNKIHNAVLSTQGQYITCNGKYIDALYFSTSNGKTEDAKYVWGNSVSYLKSVDSHWDIGISSYNATKTIALSTLSSKLGRTINSNSSIQIISRTTGDRVNIIKFASKEFTGVQIRTLLGLRSADFDVKIVGSNAVFTTRGYGHGVGMSQYGANGMAKEGYTYKQILTHYYTGISIGQK